MLSTQLLPYNTLLRERTLTWLNKVILQPKSISQTQTTLHPSTHSNHSQNPLKEHTCLMQNPNKFTTPPPLTRTDPCTLTHSGSMFGDARCGVGWRVSVTPTCLSQLIFGPLTNIKGKVCVMQCNGFPVSKWLLFVFTLTNGMERRRKVEWKKRNLWQPGVFSLFSGMFHLVKASEWEGTCVLCWSEWFGEFSRGVCWPKGYEWEWMCVVWEH